MGESSLVGATDGGVITVFEGDVSALNILDQIYSSEPTATLTIAESKLILIGYSNGTIDILDNSGDLLERLSDIVRVERFESKTINSFFAYENSLYVATDFGVIEYSLDNYLVNNSFFNFGIFDTGIQVNNLVVSNDSMIVSTPQGIAKASLQDELNDAGVWDNYTGNEGLFSDRVDKIEAFNDSLYALNGGKLQVLQNDNWIETYPALIGTITDVQVSADKNTLSILTESYTYLIDINGNIETYDTEFAVYANTIGVNNNNVYIGTDFSGIISIDRENGQRSEILPNGPQLNYFNNLLLEGDTLVGTTVSEFPGSDPLNPIRGYSIRRDNMWENFNRLYNQELSAVEAIYSLGQTENYYFLGSWGNGIVRHRKSDNEITVFNRQNSNLKGINSDEDFIVASALAADSDNNMWAVSFLSESPLNVWQNDTEEWTNFGNLTTSDNYYRLFIDSNDQKWISLITNTNNGLGLLVLDTNDLNDESDDTYIKLTDDPGSGNLPHPKVNAISEDKDGEIWIGTDRGIARFIFPEFVIDGSLNERQAQWLINEDTTALSRFLLRDLHITAMAVNSANQKWIGSSNQGIWLLNAEGSKILKRFTSENSNLISNSINDIQINDRTGVVYISTNLGLISYRDVPNAPVDKMNSLKVYPNPFRYTEHEEILIDGLSEESNIKILGVDGFVLNEIEARGGRVSWDGLSFSGDKLGTGVYYIVASSVSGKERGIGKIVIIKE